MAEELAAGLAENDSFGFEPADVDCLAANIAETLTEAEINEVLARFDENLEPNDPMTDSVISVFDSIGVCLGGERLLTVLLEPEFAPEIYTCALETFESDDAQIDLGVGLMAVELADLPVAPGRYAAIVDEFDEACGSLFDS